MPIYKLKCSNCDKTFENIMSVKEGDFLVSDHGICPFCFELDTLTKVPSCSSFTINGYSYKNGYNKKSTKRK